MKKYRIRFFFTQVLNNFEKVQNTVFLTPIMTKKGRFLDPFSIFELQYCLVGSGEKLKIVPPISLTHLKKETEKN